MTSDTDPRSLLDQITGCRLCAERFAATETRHAPRPVYQWHPDARILIAGQAPGFRVHESGRPFNDPSGVRLRSWLGMDEAAFYGPKLAILPMAFCFPGYDAKGSDLPPPKICARTWHGPLFDALPPFDLTVLVGGYAQTWHLKSRGSVTANVLGWRAHAPTVFPLPHPSWRNTGWLKKNPWFDAELVPALQARVREVMR